MASTTGLKRYLDATLKLLDARRSAEAVRDLLDEALVQVRPRVEAAGAAG